MPGDRVGEWFVGRREARAQIVIKCDVRFLDEQLGWREKCIVGAAREGFDCRRARTARGMGCVHEHIIVIFSGWEVKQNT